MPKMRSKNGSPLSLDRELCRLEKSQIFFTICDFSFTGMWFCDFDWNSLFSRLSETWILGGVFGSKRTAYLSHDVHCNCFWTCYHSFSFVPLAVDSNQYYYPRNFTHELYCENFSYFFLQESSLKGKNPFNLGMKTNFRRLCGENPILWCLPISTNQTTGYDWEKREPDVESHGLFV